MVSATIDTRQLNELLGKVTARQGAVAMSRGLNDAIKQGRTVSKRAVRERYNIPLNRIAGTSRGKMIDIKRAKSTDLNSELLADVTKTVHLIKFAGVSGQGVTLKRTKQGSFLRRKGKTVSNPVTKGKRPSVKVKIMKGGARKTIKGAFMAKTKSGHVGVFGRGTYDGTGDFKWAGKGERGKVQELGAMTLYKAMSSTKVQRKIMSTTEAALGRRTKYWLERALGLHK